MARLPGCPARIPAVGQLSVMPPTERLEQTMLPTKEFQVPVHRQSARRRILMVERTGVIRLTQVVTKRPLVDNVRHSWKA